MKNREKNHSGMEDSVITVNTTQQVERYGRAASQYIKGYQGEEDALGNVVKKGHRHIAQSKVSENYKYQNLKQQAGFNAEVKYVNDENARRIIDKKDTTRVERSNDLGRGNDPVFDVLSVDENGNPSWGAQMKFCGRYGSQQEIIDSSENLVKKMAGDKWERYRGNKVLVPKEQYEPAKAYAEQQAKDLSAQAEKFRAQGNLEKADLLEKKALNFRQVANDLQDSGVTSEEVMFIRNHPKLATAKYVAKTAHQSGMENAKSAAVITSVISGARHIVAVVNGEETVVEAGVEIVKETAAGAATAYVIGASDTVIRSAMSVSKSGVVHNLSKSNVPALIASTAVQVAKSLIRYANGEINSVQLAQELGEKGTGMMAASLGGAVGASIGTLIFPGIGTVVGGVAGGMISYIASSTVYQACMQVLNEEKLSGERLQRIRALSSATIEALDSQGRDLETMIEKFYANRQAVFENSLETLVLSGRNHDLFKFTNALNSIVVEMGQTLQFKNFDEFDDFMMDSSVSFKF